MMINGVSDDNEGGDDVIDDVDGHGDNNNCVENNKIR